LDPDETAGLIPTHIATQSDLNAWEQANIAQGESWAFRQLKRDILEEGFVRELHRRMFGDTWKWAGTFRRSNKNIGVDWPQIAVGVRLLLENCRHQIEHKVYPPEELAARFHHALVSIHAFPNGNGRHARLMADVLLVRLGGPRFSWGAPAASLNGEGGLRKRYLDSLRAADRGDFKALLKFLERG